MVVVRPRKGHLRFLEGLNSSPGKRSRPLTSRISHRVCFESLLALIFALKIHKHIKSSLIFVKVLNFMHAHRRYESYKFRDIC